MKGERRDMGLAAVYVVVVLVMSFACFVIYGLDKRQAQTDGRRVPENTLHLLELLGGWPGALVAQRLYRHKTRKLSFRIVFWLMVVLHLAIVGGTCYAAFMMGHG